MLSFMLAHSSRFRARWLALGFALRLLFLWQVDVIAHIKRLSGFHPWCIVTELLK